MSSNNKKIPKYWRHDPNIHDGCGYTVALNYAKNGKVPPDEWYHDRYKRAFHEVIVWNNKRAYIIKYFMTVEDLLRLNNVKVPPEWTCCNLSWH